MGYRNYIGGEWVEARDGKTYTKPNPATGESLGEFPSSGEEDARKKANRIAKDILHRHQPTPLPAQATRRIEKEFGDLLEPYYDAMKA